MHATDAKLEQIAARATLLYSRPTVAIEIVRLTEQPNVDARALKNCIENDPALTCKILRVVNSSLFGLSREVTDLNQAVALLGIKPLKLLVLGFSLPDALFAEVASKQLEWYWTTTLTRAVAARLLSEQLWHLPGDEAFIAALLQDIGILVLVRELGAPYAKFLGGVMEEKRDLAALQRTAIGFDHNRLSAALLTHWKMPEKLVEAIATPKQTARLARLVSPDADLPQILHLADLLAQLVGQRRLCVLPDLLEAGEAYQALTKPKLTELVKQLQPQVDQLADVLSLELIHDRNYQAVLIAAHEQLAVLVEDFAAVNNSTGLDQLSSADQPPGAEDRIHGELLEHSQELSGAMSSFLVSGGSPSHSSSANHLGQGMPEDSSEHEPRWAITSVGQLKNTSALIRKLSVSASRCREKRQELSLLLVEPRVYGANDDVNSAEIGRQVRSALGRACAVLDHGNVTLVMVAPNRTAAILANCERRAAVSIAHHAIASLDTFSDRLKPPKREIEAAVDRAVDTTTGEVAETNIVTSLSAGVATVAGVLKNFDPVQLLDRAERCLNAARLSSFSAVKSIEM